MRGVGIGIGLPGVNLGGAGGVALPWYEQDSDLANSLVAFWKLDEASGQRNDSIGTNHLADNNTVLSAAGKVYPLAATFAADANEYLSIASNAALSAGNIDFWMAAWVYPGATTPYNRIIFGKDNSAAGNREFNLFIRTAPFGSLFTLELFKATDVSVTCSATSHGAAQVDVWQLVIAWHNAATDTLNIQVNNGIVDTVASGGALQVSGAAQVRIGAREYAASPSYMTGRIGPVAFGKGYAPNIIDRQRIYIDGGGTSPLHPDPGTLSVITADGALGGSQINSMSYRDSGITTWGGYQVCCYWGVGRYLVIGKRTSGGAWTLYTYDGTGGRPTIQCATPLDNHNTCVLGIDPDGYLHVTYDHHNNALNYRKSNVPLSSWTGALGSTIAMLGANEDTVAYPTFTNDPSGKLYFLFRNGGGSGNADSWLYAYNEESEAWAAATGTGTGGKLIDGLATTPDQNYYHYGAPRFDADFGSGGYMHLAGHWRETTNGTTNHDVTYAKWDGTSWYQSNGTAQTIPITLANCDILDAVAQGDGANQGLVGLNAIDCDADGNPHLVYGKNNASDWAQIYHAYHNGTSWTITALSAQAVVSSNGDENLSLMHKPEIAIDKATNTIYVFYPAFGALGAWIACHVSVVGSGIWATHSLHDTLLGYCDSLTYDRALWEDSGILDILAAPYTVGPTELPIYLIRYEP